MLVLSRPWIFFCWQVIIYLFGRFKDFSRSFSLVKICFSMLFFYSRFFRVIACWPNCVLSKPRVSILRGFSSRNWRSPGRGPYSQISVPLFVIHGLNSFYLFNFRPLYRILISSRTYSIKVWYTWVKGWCWGLINRSSRSCRTEPSNL